MSALLEYKNYVYEVGANLRTHGRHEGKWSPTFNILQTPTKKSDFEYCGDSESSHTETRKEAEDLAKSLAKAWIESQKKPSEAD